MKLAIASFKVALQEIEWQHIIHWISCCSNIIAFILQFVSGQANTTTYTLQFPFAENAFSDRIVAIADGVVVAPTNQSLSPTKAVDAKEAV